MFKGKLQKFNLGFRDCDFGFPKKIKAGLCFVRTNMRIHWFSLQSISSNSFLLKRVNLFGVIQTWSRRSKPAAIAQACCGKQMPSAAIFIFRTNLVCVLIEMSRRVGCRCMHDFMNCKKMRLRSADFWRILLAAKHVFKSEVGTVQPHSLCKYWSHAQT